MKKWWAIQVLTGQEYEVKKELLIRYLQCEVFIPRRRVMENNHGKISWKTEHMLPGYIIVSNDTEIDPKEIESFIRIVGIVTNDEMDHLKSMEEYDETDINIGDRVIIVNGHLAGCKGNILSRNKESKTSKCHLSFNDVEFDIDIRDDYISCIQSGV